MPIDSRSAHMCVSQVQALDPMLAVLGANGLDKNSVAFLEPWCGQDQAVALWAPQMWVSLL